MISKIEITAAFIGDEPKTIHVIKTTIGRDKIDTPFDILFSSAALPTFPGKIISPFRKNFNIIGHILLCSNSLILSLYCCFICAKFRNLIF